jgi:peptide/nickel transport system permease protein
MLSRIIYGSRISLKISGAGVTLALLLGLLLGAMAGYYGGITDNVIMRLMDIQLSFPMILLAILIVAILGPGIPNTIVAVAFPSVPIFARLIRGTFLSIKTLEYVEAAKALGCSDLRIIFRHLLPNSLAPITVQGSLRAATILLTAAGLSFLGLGVQPPTPEWGALLSDGRAFLRIAPWVVIAPGIAIMLVVLGLNLLGDGLRDASDPRLR